MVEGIYIALILACMVEAAAPYCDSCTSPNTATAAAPAPGPAQAPALTRIFDVTSYGAVADGKTESSLAFLTAWNDACNHLGNATVLIPNGTFFLNPVSFSGPCYKNQSPKVVINGTLKAPRSLNAFPTPSWIVFNQLNGLHLNGVSGTALLNAQGAEVWTLPHCRQQLVCYNFPITLRLMDVSNGSISNISLLNSKAFHMSILRSDNIALRGISIRAPWDSPNTDGIHISNSTNINITSSIIGVGDDCISIGPGSVNISILNVTCGPGHGISIGSLGRYPDEMDVVGVNVRNCTINGTQNGVRIKTWPGAPQSLASELLFEDILMINVSNPILIDQEYCPWSSCTSLKPSLVKLRDIYFKNIRGTFNTDSAVSLHCSPSVSCENLQLVDIDLKHITTNNGDPETTSTCLSVKGALQGLQLLHSRF